MAVQRSAASERWGNRSPRPEGETGPAPVHPFSMTDEEGDLDAFHHYLRTLPPDALWDILSHLDEEQYPRRHEATQREIARRRLLFVTPYTAQEIWLRGMFGWSLLLAVLAAALRGIASQQIDLYPGQRLTFFYDLAVGGPPAARMVLPLERTVACLGEIAVIGAVSYAVFRCLHRRLRPDVLMTGVAALTLGGLFLLLAYR